METTWDKLRAVLLALGLHLLVLAVLFVGLRWQHLPTAADAAGPVIEATLVSSPQQSRAVVKAVKAAEQKADPEATPPPQPQPEPRPQDAPQPQQAAPQAPLPKPDTVNQDEVRRLAEQAAEKKQQEQEERRKQAQIDLTNQQQQQQEAQNKLRLAQQELEKQQKLDAIRKQLADAKRATLLQEQKLKQLQDQRAQLAQNNAPATATQAAASVPQSGANGADQGLLEQYKRAIIEVTNNNWIHTDVPERVHCIIQFTQIPGGEVIDVKYLNCPFTAAARESVDRAMHKSSLPYAGYEKVFPQLRQWSLDFCYPQEACRR
ncbi:MAG: cell envelope integrity protein TolA [Lysobacteraceae bacterium]